MYFPAQQFFFFFSLFLRHGISQNLQLHNYSICWAFPVHVRLMIWTTRYISGEKVPVLDFAVEVSDQLGLRAVWSSSNISSMSSTDKDMVHRSAEGVVGHWEEDDDDTVTVFWCLRDKTVGNKVCKVCSWHRCCDIIMVLYMDLLPHVEMVLGRFYALCCDDVRQIQCPSLWWC